jgi:dTDP-glucose 4,6-dehydratase
VTLPHRDLEHVLRHMRSWDKLRGQRIFLTGSSGFVGTWLTESFAWANERLGLRAELTKISRSSLPHGDFEFGIHAAKSDSFAEDVDGTRRILDFAAERGVSRFLFTSSGAVYGRLPIGMTHVAEDFVGEPETDYARAKLESERLCGQSGLCAVIARLFAFVGPGLALNANFAVGNFVRDVMAGAQVTVQGDGTARRSYLYAADLAIWLWTLLLEGASGKVYNVGSLDAVSIYELAQIVVENTVPGTRIVVVGQGASSVYIPSDTRARTELHLTPLISLAEGIRRMYAWNLPAKDREMTLVPATTA